MRDTSVHTCPLNMVQASKALCAKCLQAGKGGWVGAHSVRRGCMLMGAALAGLPLTWVPQMQDQQGLCAGVQISKQLLVSANCIPAPAAAICCYHAA